MNLISKLLLMRKLRRNFYKLTPERLLELQQRLVELGTDGLGVVIITGHGDVPMAVQALKAGAEDFIEKPFDDGAIMDCVRRVIADRAVMLEGGNVLVVGDKETVWGHPDASVQNFLLRRLAEDPKDTNSGGGFAFHQGLHGCGHDDSCSGSGLGVSGGIRGCRNYS